MGILVKSAGRHFEIQMLRTATWGLSRFGELRGIGKRLLWIWLGAFCLGAAISFLIILFVPVTVR
jgi:hypothetical protein